MQDSTDTISAAPPASPACDWFTVKTETEWVVQSAGDGTLRICGPFPPGPPREFIPVPAELAAQVQAAISAAAEQVTPETRYVVADPPLMVDCTSGDVPAGLRLPAGMSAGWWEEG
jgi:hypothetical protein